MEKLPISAKTAVDAMLTEIKDCHKRHPHNHVRLPGFDNCAQSANTILLVYRAKSAQDCR
jgi:ribulose-bisphosphate carboxylase small chain